ncbi:TPA: hypothetical protein HA278_08265 [Candidatus Woesearchaeota archaeon]|nr:hypothetical protein [archaeon]HIJ12026.1 hypothetical protein [Candidatus Woesearchaeota archaeon]|tara:strand:- start:589 stop:1203 length:615 start_codon:yes stop_codon:yes gene_type:complete
MFTWKWYHFVLIIVVVALFFMAPTIELAYLLNTDEPDQYTVEYNYSGGRREHHDSFMIFNVEEGQVNYFTKHQTTWFYAGGVEPTSWYNHCQVDYVQPDNYHCSCEKIYPNGSVSSPTSPLSCAKSYKEDSPERLVRTMPKLKKWIFEWPEKWVGVTKNGNCFEKDKMRMCFEGGVLVGYEDEYNVWLRGGKYNGTWRVVDLSK